MRITLARLRRVAPQGVIVEHERTPVGGAYLATAPAGQRFNEGPHQLVAAWGGALGLDGSPADARRDLFERLSEVTLEPCADPECSSCIDDD